MNLIKMDEAEERSILEDIEDYSLDEDLTAEEREVQRSLYRDLERIR